MPCCRGLPVFVDVGCQHISTQLTRVWTRMNACLGMGVCLCVLACACMRLVQPEFQWGNPAAKDELKDLVRSSVTGALRSAVLAGVANVVSEFMSM